MAPPAKKQSMMREKGGKSEPLLPFPVSKEGGEVRMSDMYSGMLEWQIFRAAQIPGPGNYNTSSFKLPNGGKFSKFTPKGYCDDEIKRASGMPGPADYPAPPIPGKSGGRFSEGNPKSELDWIALRARETPGPADIPAPKYPLPSGGRFSRANPKSDVEWLMYRAAQMPGPADYEVKPPSAPSGGRFGNANPKSELDWIAIREKQLPGPGQYHISRPIQGGGRFNLSKVKTDLDWIMYHAAQLPGPGQYDAAKALDNLVKTPTCRILGRTGPKNLPWPYGGQKPPPKTAGGGREHDRSESAPPYQGRHESPPGTAWKEGSPQRRGTGTRGGGVHLGMGRPSRPSSQVGNHPLAEDPSSPLHRWKRLAKVKGAGARPKTVA